MYSFQEYLPYYRRNLKMAFPVMLTQLGATLVGLADSIMVGHYATADLAAVSFSNALFFTVMVFAIGALMGITPLVGFQVGKNDDNSTNHIVSLLQNGIWFTCLLAGFSLFLLGGCIPFLDYFGQDPSVIRIARPYYILIVLSIIPFLFFCLEKQFLEGLGNTMVAMILSIIMNGLNILLNWVFIFGHWGCPAMGATGAGIATLISRTLMPICFFIVILSKDEWRYYFSQINRHLNSWKRIHQLLKIGTPIGAQTFLETIVFTASFIFIGWISKEALAAHQISNQIADMTFMLAQGIGAATTIRVSHQYGRGDLHAVRMASNASIHLVLLMNTIGADLMIFLRHQIPYIFTNDPQVVEIASTLILFAGLWQYADGLQCVAGAMLRGIGDVKVPMIYAFISYVVVAMPLGLFLMFPCKLGAPGMWISFIVALTIAAILLHVRFRNQLKKIEKRVR